MDNHEIERNLRHLPAFRGVYAIDTLPTHVLHYPAAYVVNSGRSDGPGEHWIAVYFCKDGSAEFFDSYAFPPEMYGIRNFLCMNSKHYIWNRKRLQSTVSFLCGAYCIYFILMKSSGIEDFLKPFDPKNIILNDCIVLDFAHKFAD
jgi:hypothetical protein